MVERRTYQRERTAVDRASSNNRTINVAHLFKEFFYAILKKQKKLLIDIFLLHSDHGGSVKTGLLMMSFWILLRIRAVF